MKNRTKIAKILILINMLGNISSIYLIVVYNNLYALIGLTLSIVGTTLNILTIKNINRNKLLKSNEFENKDWSNYKVGEFRNLNNENDITSAEAIATYARGRALHDNINNILNDTTRIRNQKGLENAK